MANTSEEEEEETVEHKWTLEDLQSMPRIDIWYLFNCQLCSQLCKRICVDVEPSEWRCTGCLINILADRGKFYHHMKWLVLLRSHVLNLKERFDLRKQETIKQHKNRFYPRYIWSRDRWVVYDQKTSKYLVLENEYLDPIKAQCSKLNKLSWTDRVTLDGTKCDV